MNKKVFMDPKIQPKRDYYSDDTFKKPIEPSEEELIQAPEEDGIDIKTEAEKLIRMYDYLDVPVFNIVKEQIIKPIYEEETPVIPTEPIRDPEKTERDVHIRETERELSISQEEQELERSTFEFSIGPMPNVILNKPDDKLNHLHSSYVFAINKIIARQFDEIRLLTNRYITEIARSVGLIDSDTFHSLVYSRYDQNTKDVPDEYKHMSDFLIKQQILKDQKYAFFQKSHRPSKTIKHLKSCEAALIMTERYEKIGDFEIKDTLDLERKKLLNYSKEEYEFKSTQNIYNLYKYLNSAVILLNENVSNLIKELQYKAILANEGIWTPIIREE